jgi:hypothetical protein
MESSIVRLDELDLIKKKEGREAVAGRCVANPIQRSRRQPGQSHHRRAQLDTPDMQPYNGGPAEYLKHLKRCRKLVKIPLIASLNDSTDGPWLDFAKKLEQAGDDLVDEAVGEHRDRMAPVDGNVRRVRDALHLHRPQPPRRRWRWKPDPKAVRLWKAN